MQKKSLDFKKYTAMAVLLLACSCSKMKDGLTSQSKDPGLSIPKFSTTSSGSLNYGDTILNVTYENGTTNSGITGVKPTNATATDAAYMVSTGETSNYAIAHKVVYGDQGYYSDGNWRSESDAQRFIPARYFPGDERRYEFSVLLKDWPVWNTGDPINESNFFQLKVSGGENVPLMLRTQRNVVKISLATCSLM